MLISLSHGIRHVASVASKQHLTNALHLGFLLGVPMVATTHLCYWLSSLLEVKPAQLKASVRHTVKKHLIRQDIQGLRNGFSGANGQCFEMFSFPNAGTGHALPWKNLKKAVLSLPKMVCFPSRSWWCSGMWLWSSVKRSGSAWALTRGLYTEMWCWKPTVTLCHWVRPSVSHNSEYAFP